MNNKLTNVKIYDNIPDMKTSYFTILFFIFINFTLFSQDIDSNKVYNAINKNNINQLSKLLEDVSPDIKLKDGNYPLILATSKKNIKMVELLLSKGANVNIAQDSGWNALMEASSKGYYDIASKLIEAGADLDAKGIKYGNTALIQAVLNNQIDIAQLLVDSGANIKIKNSSGKTAYDRALELNLYDIASIVEVKPMSNKARGMITILIILACAALFTFLGFYWLDNYMGGFSFIFIWLPIILVVLYIFLPINFVAGPYEEIILFLFSIENALHNKLVAREGDFKPVVSFFKWTSFIFGMLCVVNSAPLWLFIINVIFMIVCIIGFLIYLILLLLAGGVDAITYAAVEGAKAGTKAAKKAWKKIKKFIEEVTLEILKELIKEEVPETHSFTIEHINQKISSAINSNETSDCYIGLYDDDGYKVGDMDIEGHIADDNIKEGMKFYV